MDLNGRILSIDNQESEITLEFCSFIMRHHRGIDYSDFTDSPFAIQRLRRFQEFKSWAEIDELHLITDNFSSQFDLFKQANNSAFQEILAYLDRITKEFTHQDIFKQETAALRERLVKDIDIQLAIKLKSFDLKKKEDE